MLTIRLSPPHQVDGRPYDRTISVATTIPELFRTVRVVGERLVFVEPRPGRLINLAYVESIEDDAEPEPDAELVNRGVPASPVLGTKSCPHDYIEGTCSQCAADAMARYNAQPDQP